MDSLKTLCCLPGVRIRNIKKVPEMDIYKKFKCYNCGNYCHPPFRKNHFGNLICEFCTEQNKIAGYHFKFHIVDTKLEDLYFNLNHSCKYQGCHFQGKGRRLIQHHKDCENVSLFCGHRRCTWYGKPKELFDHCRNNHPQSLKIDKPNYKLVVDSRRSIFDSPEGEHRGLSFVLIMAYGQVFLLKLFVNVAKQIVCYVATNMEPLKIEGFKLMIEFNLDEGRKSIADLDLVATNNFNRADILARHKNYVLSNDISSDYTIYIKKNGH
ncbi:hypothetical protein WA026_010980 [Henosepilachna vigintioctopunctata]|uniref:GATA-type domain-containing protein n=1 Tax=Henosepilachna vigintioctopunctata TaxID=420089 RepID=A0AAW1URP9_9CUCU